MLIFNLKTMLYRVLTVHVLAFSNRVTLNHIANIFDMKLMDFYVCNIVRP